MVFLSEVEGSYRPLLVVKVLGLDPHELLSRFLVVRHLFPTEPVLLSEVDEPNILPGGA